MFSDNQRNSWPCLPSATPLERFLNPSVVRTELEVDKGWDSEHPPGFWGFWFLLKQIKGVGLKHSILSWPGWFECWKERGIPLNLGAFPISHLPLLWILQATLCFALICDDASSPHSLWSCGIPPLLSSAGPGASLATIPMAAVTPRALLLSLGLLWVTQGSLTSFHSSAALLFLYFYFLQHMLAWFFLSHRKHSNKHFWGCVCISE